MPKSRKGKVIDPTSSICEPLSRPSIGIVIVLVTPWMVSAPVAETWMVWPLAPPAGKTIGDDSWKVAVG